jgi:C1A family cysteine protease
MIRFSSTFGGLWTRGRGSRDGASRHAKHLIGRQAHLRGLRLESLEDRTLLSAAPTIAFNPVTHTTAYAPVTVQQSSSAVASSPLASSFPSSYDLRNVSGGSYITSVKDQGSWGTCWAFATYGSLESSILKAGGTTNDFSERNLAYKHGFDWGPDDGGNTWISEAYLSRFSGPINESDDPYANMGSTDSVTGPVQDYVREMLRFDTDSEIKNAIMTYGALDTSMYWTDSSYRSSDCTYYYSGSVSQNHDVTIVGWDDTKVTAGGTGAWLIRNSWGTDWGDGGYFWLSYADTEGGNAAESFGSAVSSSNYSKAYYWDTYGNVSELNTSYAFNKYTTTSACLLKSVGFFTEADSASYTITIYDTYSSGKLSSPLATISGTETYAGYHTVDLSSAVSLASGNDFYVYLHLTNGGTYPMAVDYAYSGYDSSSTASSGQSYYSMTGTGWTDLTTLDSTANFCIKALVQEYSTAPGTPDLVTGSDSGTSSADNLTKLDNSTLVKELQFLVSGTVAGATVTIYSDGTAIGSATASGTTTTVATNGTYDLADGSHSITARQTESGKQISSSSSALSVTIDTTAPTATIGRLTPTTSVTNATSVTFFVQFSESVLNVDVSDFALALGGTVTTGALSVGDNGDSDASTYTVTVSTIAGEGDVDLNMIAGQNIGDSAGNSFNSSTGITSEQTYTISHTRTWDGGGADGNWTTAANWSDDLAPVAGDILVFAGTTQTSSNNDYAAGTVFDSIVFSNGGFIISGNSVKLIPTGGAAINNRAGLNQIDLSIATDSTGSVIVKAGTLELGVNAQSLVLTGGGVDIQAGKLVLDYSSSSPADTVQNALAWSYDSGLWDRGQFTSTTAESTGLVLGWKDDGVSQVTVRATYAGDFNLDGTVNLLDFDVWTAHLGASSATFPTSDANYDGAVNLLDFDLWMATMGQTLPSGSTVTSSSSVASSTASAATTAVTSSSSVTSSLAAALIGDSIESASTSTTTVEAVQGTSATSISSSVVAQPAKAAKASVPVVQAKPAAALYQPSKVETAVKSLSSASVSSATLQAAHDAVFSQIKPGVVKGLVG